jgi:SsrA-binding protein
VRARRRSRTPTPPSRAATWSCTCRSRPTPTGYEGHEPTRPRKLLLHRKQIEQLAARINERGLTLVPLRIYFKNQLVKVELGLARGKRAYDKRQSIAKRDAEREMARARKARTRA